MHITSVQNENVKRWTKLSRKKYIYEFKEVLVEGEHLVEEALKSGRVKTLILTEKFKDIKFNGKTYYINGIISEKISSTKNPQGIFAVSELLYSEITTYDRLLLLDGVSDPGNLGTLIRTACAFGFNGIFLGENSVDIHNEKVLRATQGAIFNIPIMQGDLKKYITSLKNNSVQILAAALENSICLDEVKIQKKVALVLGNEGQGISMDILKESDLITKIPISNIESLNVAVAGGIIMHKIASN